MTKNFTVIFQHFSFLNYFLGFMRNPLLPVLLLLLVPLLTSCLPLDCDYLYSEDRTRPSGVYTIYPMGGVSGVQVFCDMDSHGGRWTVFQRRMDGSVNFHRNWERYKVGFGNAAGEYWLGLESLFHLTQLKKNELLVDMEDFEGRKVYARYSSFSITPESDGYGVNVSGFVDGGAGDTLSRHDGQKFATFDKYQHAGPDNCARQFLGAFWYWRCYYPNPNGVYLWGADGSKYEVGVVWYSWKGTTYSLKSISMKIRPIR
ncbi:microfibril-associated glycoprotein 4 isoform X2 [Nothobranchius furzeri]|uniref:Transcript variant X2 n=1 Tax=Nothobranchius furzeri TaxID=105023 RepID=A0A9D2XJX3_NOTFU|nr:microfibril-associated glycoprotein 4 isoform X2 [Nothobranchius furzeri]KAF7203626.1 transcript variant X2 [Nothobranchius furzeri]